MTHQSDSEEEKSGKDSITTLQTSSIQINTVRSPEACDLKTKKKLMFVGTNKLTSKSIEIENSDAEDLVQEQLNMLEEAVAETRVEKLNKKEIRI